MNFSEMSEQKKIEECVEFLRSIDRAREEHIDLVYEKEPVPLPFSTLVNSECNDTVCVQALVSMLPVALVVARETAKHFRIDSVTIGPRCQTASTQYPLSASLLTKRTPWKLDPMCTGQALVIRVTAERNEESYREVVVIDDPAAFSEREQRLVQLYDFKTKSKRRIAMLEKKRAAILAKPLPKISRLIQRTRSVPVRFSGALWVRMAKESAFLPGSV